MPRLPTWCIIFPAFFFPISAFAAPYINEIFYDASGSDSGHEWIEIYNPDVTQVDLTGWRFYAAGSNHTLSATAGESLILPALSFAVIADNVDTFLTDHASFSGQLINSSFSLSNTSDTLMLRDTSLAAIDQVTYLSTWGGTNGLSLEKSLLGWASGPPGGTPGQINSQSVTPTPMVIPSPTVEPSPTPEPTSIPTTTPEPTIAPTPTPTITPLPSATPSPTPCKIDHHNFFAYKPPIRNIFRHFPWHFWWHWR
jgi:hypothetical protein